MMLRTGISLLLLVLTWTSAAQDVPPYAKLDLGFEEPVTRWRQNSSAPFDVMEVVTADPNLVRSGEKSMRLVREGKRPSGEALEGHCHTLDSIPVEGMGVERVSLFARGKGSVSMAVYRYKLVDGNEAFHSSTNLPAFDGKPQPPLKGDAKWHEYSFKLDTANFPEEVTSVRLVIAVAGEVVVDDVAIGDRNAAGKADSTSATGKQGEADAPRPNLLTVGTTKLAPKGDGVLAEQEYPTLLTGLIDNETRDLYPYPNKVALSHDAQRLYVAVELHLPPGYELKPQGAGNDDPSMIASADTLFLMLREASQPESPAFTGVYTAIDSAGMVYDALEAVDWKAGACTRDAKFNAKWSVQSAVNKQGVWTVELSAPWSALKLPAPKPGDRVLLSLGIKLRDRILTWQSFSNWIDHYGAFGVLRLDPTPLRVQLSELAGLAQGKAHPTFKLNNDASKEKAYDLTYMIARPRMVGGGIGGWVYDVAIDARRKEIVRGQSVYFWDRSGKLAAGETSVESDSHGLAEPAYYVLEAEARVDGQAVFYQRLPFHFAPPIRVTLSPIPSRQILEASLDLRGAAPEQRKEMILALVNADGKSSHQQKVSITGTEMVVSLPIGTLSPGDYQLTLSMLNVKGEESSRLSTPFHKPADPTWLTDPAGIEARSPDWAPIPWTPMQVNGTTVSAWARTFQFEKGSLIAGITSRQRKVLSAPVMLKYIRGGEEISVAFGSPKVEQLGKGRVAVHQTAESPDFEVAASQTIEFDGMTLIDLTLTPRSAESVDAIWVEIPIADANLSVLQARAGIGSHWWQRGVPSDDTFLTPRRYDSIWLGNEDAGLSYFVNNYKGWLIDSRQPRVHLQSQGEDRTLKLMLANVPTKVATPMKVRLGLQPTPFRPVLPTARGFRPSSDYNSSTINLYLAHSSAWNSSDSKPSPRTWEMFNELVSYHHANGKRVNPYIATYQLAPWDFYRRTVPFNLRRESFPPEWLWYKKSEATRVEEYDYHQRDWQAVPRHIAPAEPETRELVSLAAGTTYDDFFAGGVRDMLTRSDFDGFFMDISCPVLNFDESRGEVYTTLDGAREGTFDALATRDLYKRLYWLFEKHRGDARRPWMIGHNLPSTAPYAAFWDMTVNGEEIKPATTFEFTRMCAAKSVTGSPMTQVPPGEFDPAQEPLAWRAAFGHHFGLANIILPQYGYKPELKTRETAREFLSVTFLHNQVVWPGFIAAEVIFDFWEKVEIPFGLADAEFRGYWNNGIRTGNAGVRVSYWKKDGREDYLLAVCNWNGQSVETAVQLPAEFASVRQITDMESGDVVSLKSGEFVVATPAHDLRVFRLAK